MDKYTIMADDGYVSVDGLGFKDLPLQLSSEIHAVQWYGTYGEIEYRPAFNPETKLTSKEPNEVFENPAKFQQALDVWEIAKIQAKEAQTQAGGAN